MKTPSGGTISHSSDDESGQVPSDFFDGKPEEGGGSAGGEGAGQLDAADTALPEGFFDDPVADAKARGIEYKVKKE